MGATFKRREDIGAPFVLKDDIGAEFVCREGIVAAFDTRAVWLTGATGLGLQVLLRLSGMCWCPAWCPGCSRQAGAWQPARSPFYCEKPCPMTEIVLRAQITELCVGTALRNGRETGMG